MSKEGPIYTLFESTLYMGGIKVKLDGSTCAQFPNMNMAINYCKTMLSKHKDDYKTIDYLKVDGSIEKIDLFD